MMRDSQIIRRFPDYEILLDYKKNQQIIMCERDESGHLFPNEIYFGTHPIQDDDGGMYCMVERYPLQALQKCEDDQMNKIPSPGVMKDGLE